MSSDGGATWHQTYAQQADSNPMGQFTPQHKAYHSSGINVTSVHYIEWTSPTNIMASYTDISGWRSTDGGASWSFPTYNGVVVNTLYKTIYSGGLLYGATSNVHDMYQSTHLLDSSTNPSWQTGAVVAYRPTRGRHGRIYTALGCRLSGSRWIRTMRIGCMRVR